MGVEYQLLVLCLSIQDDRWSVAEMVDVVVCDQGRVVELLVLLL